MKSLLIAWLLTVACPAFATEVELRAAWGGVAVLSAFTELEVAIRSEEAGPVTLLLGSGAQTRIELDLPEAERLTITVPYPVSRLGPVAWQVLRDGDIVGEGTADVFTRVARHSWDVDLTGSATHPRTVAATASTLPEWTQAYDGIRTLTLTAHDLRELSGSQVQALEGHLLRCGRLVIPDAHAALVTRLRRIAGCGGRHVGVADATRLPPELPAGGEVIGLVDCTDCGGTLKHLGSVLLAYGLLLLAAAMARWNRAFIALGVLTSVVLYAAHRAQAPYVTWLSWSQAEASGLIEVRRTALIVEGRGTAELALPMPPNAIVSLPLPEGAALHYTLGAGKVGSAVLTVPTGVLRRVQLSFVDAGPVEAATLAPATGPAEALAGRLERQTGLRLDLGQHRDEIAHPSTGHRQIWQATVEGGARRGE